MAIYPKANHDEFMRRAHGVNWHLGWIKTSSLRPLINVLENANGTPNSVDQAITALAIDKKQKYADAINYLRWTYAGLPTYLNNQAQALLTVVFDLKLTDRAVQAALDILSVAAARANRTAIEYLLTLRPALEYIGLETFETAFTGQFTVDLPGDFVRYTSRHFHAKAKIYSIVPATVQYDIGFIQICESRNDKQSFRQDALNTRWEMQGGFPRSDSSADGNIPWYHVGVGFGCTEFTARRNYVPRESETYELDDNFEKNTALRVLVYSKQNLPQQAVIERIERRQMFTAWFAYKRSASQDYRILRQVGYGFNFTIKLDGVPMVAHRLETPVPIIETTPARDAPLPMAALEGPTMNQGQTLKVYAANVYKCPIALPIVLL